MAKLLVSAALTVSVLAPSAAFAADKTVTLAVKNMYCAIFHRERYSLIGRERGGWRKHTNCQRSEDEKFGHLDSPSMS